ncbi:MAG TPA: hypothetical protein DC054_00150 [Blastocatellia bacterium]|nr:hypothetical protein [Blastocatellia bacterium]
MKRLLPILFVLVTQPGLAAQSSAQPRHSDGNEKSASGNASFKLPAEIKVILKVDELPGADNSGSFWEGVYEIRVADWRTIVEKTKADEKVEDSGVIILQSSFSRRALLDKGNRTLVISIPVTGSLLERLQQQPKTPQAFLLSSTVRLFDAQLARNFALKIDRIWRFKLFPDGEATILIRIQPDGSWSVHGPAPKEMPAGYSIIGGPPPTTKP